MAIFRKIHTSFWSDTFVQDLDNDHKLFYLYLLTNERTKQCGIYEISKKQMSFDLGYSIDRVSKLLKYFINVDRIMYNELTKELALKNWNKFNGSTSPKVVSCIKSELKNVKDTVLIEYINGIYTASQEEQEEEQEEEQDKSSKSIDFNSLLDYFNTSFGKSSRVVNEKVKKSINARLKEGYTKEDFKKCIDNLKEDSWHIENNYKYCTLEFISRSDKLDKYTSIVKVNDGNDDYYNNVMKQINGK